MIDILRCGVDGALVELEGLEPVLALRAALRAARPAGVLELVPAARTLLIRFDPSKTSVARLRDVIAAQPLISTLTAAPGEVVVPVRYDGADLAEVASAAGLTPAEVVERHLTGHYTAAFCGFAPGFAYLTGLDPVLQLPRRATPRTCVPTGSVALADAFTGIYPRSSPGGWRLIGTTAMTVWDIDRTPPTVLVPGTPVRFQALKS